MIKDIASRNPAKKGHTSKALQTRHLILEHAVKIFSTKGFHNSKVDDIVQSAGLAKGTVYQYFKSKEEVLDACMELLSARVTQYLDFFSAEEASSPCHTREEFRQFLKRSCEGFFSLFQSNRTLFKLCMGAQLELPRIESEFRQMIDRCVRTYDRFLQNAKNCGFVKATVSSHWLAMFSVNAAMGTAHEIFNTEARPFTPEMLEHFVSFLAEGCRF